jgi:NAD(P)-dependent dehydrogenase (short-subunit alcohol dehydrogenase family)
LQKHQLSNREISKYRYSSGLLQAVDSLSYATSNQRLLPELATEVCSRNTMTLIGGYVNYAKLFDLSNRTALVIGAGSGIGRESARGLADFGAEVICADRNLEAAQETAAATGGQALELDITDLVQLANLPEEIDILVCTPSINVRRRMLEYTPDDFDRVVALNLKGTFFAMQAAARRMAARGKGSIIVFSSIRAQVVEPGQSVYAATKAGALQLVRTLAAELGERGVRVNAVAPGVVETPLTAPIKAQPDWYNAYAQKSALKRWATPDELVGAVVYLASDAASFVTGTLLLVDGGWLAVDGRFTPPL